ncbi:MAG: hypothetical protein NC218_01060 [Acetobacter sp.]|nr:hypothetical protein [Acetobacter sp.]
MSNRIFRDDPYYAGTSKHSSDVCTTEFDRSTLSMSQLSTLWANGDREIVRTYVEKHFLGSALQIWLMRTGDVELIKAYLKRHPHSGLFEDAEELLMALNSYELRKVYLDQWHLRRSSILLLFAEKEFALLRRYVVKHPEECFSRTMLSLMFETGDKKLIRQYTKVHPSLLDDERYADRLQKFGLVSTASI